MATRNLVPFSKMDKADKKTKGLSHRIIDRIVSGSPILQNGKIVGAVTHVLVNDPTRGYGIFIEDMIK